MRVFLTSASGHVGAAVAQAFLQKGHNLSALTRSSEKAERLQRSGVRAVVGSLLDLDSYSATAAAHDVIIHTAFEYDDEGRERLDTDRIAAEALVAAAGATQHPVHLIYTSSAFLLAGLSSEFMDESIDTGLVRSSRPRLETEQIVLTAGNARLRTSVLRLGVVYGGTSFTMDELFSSAKRDGRVLYRAHPQTRWPLIYLHDAAALYVAIAEQGAAGIYHAVDGYPLPVAQVAELASRAAGCGGLAARSAADSADLHEHDDRVSRDAPVISTRSLELGWFPQVHDFTGGVNLAFSEWGRLHDGR